MAIHYLFLIGGFKNFLKKQLLESLNKIYFWHRKCLLVEVSYKFEKMICEDFG